MTACRLRATTLRLVLALCVALWMQGAAAAPAAYADSEVKAAFLYRFAGYVEWPAAAMQAPRFVIAVFGADTVAASLERALATIRIKDRPGEVRRIQDIGEARQAHIVYVGAVHADELDTLLPQLANRPVLIVTDGERGLDAGGMLNFRMVGQRVRFEVALDTAQEAGLAIGAELLAVAMQVRRRDLRSDEPCAPSLQSPWRPCVDELLAEPSRPRQLPCAPAHIDCGPREHPQIRSKRAWFPPG